MSEGSFWCAGDPVKQLILAKGTFPRGMELWAYSSHGHHAMLPLERSALADLGVPWVLKVGQRHGGCTGMLHRSWS